MLKQGEIVHVVERRFFPGDVRRHFAGAVVASSDVAFRVQGHLFVYDSGPGGFIKQNDVRTRVISYDNRVIINVLPAGLDPMALRYALDETGALMVCDDAGFELDINEFGGRE